MPRDGEHAFRLPPVQAEHLDRVIQAAGTNLPAALSVLISALGWYLARTCMPSVRAAAIAMLPRAIVRASALHADGAGHG